MLLYALQLPIMVSKFQHSNYFMDESKKKKTFSCDVDTENIQNIMLFGTT